MSAAAGPGISGLRQVALQVRDVAASRAFYRDVLGLPFLFDAGPDLAFFEVGGVRIMLSRGTGRNEAVASTVLYFEVADADAAHASAVAGGAADERAPKRTATLSDYEIWIGFVRDPDGHLVGLLEERPLTPDA